MPDVKKSDQQQKVLDYIRKKKMVSPGDKLVVAVSGGPDSVCLLYILSSLRRELGIELHIAHLNHQLRSKDSAADAGYVTGLARRLNIPATIESRDVNAYRKKNRISLEEAAREVRYNFLAQVAKKVGAARVAVGHNADDHIETILMHLLRGSGTRGLRGLIPISQWKSDAGNLTIVRPLLELSREETVAFCRRLHLKPRIDITNLSPEMFRNRIRRYLLPELRKYNPQVAEALLRTARIAADDLDFIDKEVDRLWPEVVREQKDAVIIHKKDFITLPLTLKRYLLRRCIESVLGNLEDIEAGHIEDVLSALDKPAGKAVGLPSGLSFTIEYDRYVLSKAAASLCPLPALGTEIALHIPGKTRVPGWNIEAVILLISEVSAGEGKSGDYSAHFDFDRTGSRLTVRSRRPGDRFQPLGMSQPKKLNEFMIDARIPRLWRRNIPIVASPEHILWVVGWRIDERVKVANRTSRVLRLEFKRNDNVIPAQAGIQSV